MTTDAYIALGSNLGAREENIRRAVDMLCAAGVRVVKSAAVRETEPLGGVEQPKYLNTVVKAETELGAMALLKVMQDIENELGRVRTGPNSSRTIDLDLLLYGQEIIDLPELKVPHPRMHLRAFVMEPLAEVDPAIMHPGIKQSASVLAARLNGQSFEIDPARAQLISIAGNIGAGKTTLARGLSEVLGAKLILEAYDTNPFLAKVYAGEKQLALDCQLYFLVTRVEQLSKKSLAAGQRAVSDYVFEKEHIYANRLLDAEQYELYCKLNRMASANVSDPVLLIHLEDAPCECLERIHQRNRPYEQQIREEFLKGLCCDYEKMAAGWKKCPIIKVKNTDRDFRRPERVEELANEIKFYIA